MALWDKIYTIIEESQTNEDPASLTEDIIAAVEEYQAYTEAQEAEDRRWNESK